MLTFKRVRVTGHGDTMFVAEPTKVEIEGSEYTVHQIAPNARIKVKRDGTLQMFVSGKISAPTITVEAAIPDVEDHPAIVALKAAGADQKTIDAVKLTL